MRMADEVIPIYIFDDRVFKGRTRWFDFPKTGKFRAKFTIEAVEDLREQLRKRGSELVVRVGKPEDVLFELAREVRSSWIFCNRARMTEELAVQNALEKKLWTIGQEINYVRG